jgi:hypothetical protein
MYSGDEVVLVDKNLELRGGWDNSFTTQTGTTTLDAQDTRTGVRVNVGITASAEYFTVQNSKGNAGAVYNRGTFTIRNFNISYNNSTGLKNGDGTLTVENTLIDRNEFGGVYLGGGTVNIYNSTISHNKGSGIFNDNNGGDVNLINVTITGNYYGLGMWPSAGQTTITNSTIAGNYQYVSNPDTAGGIVNDGAASKVVLRNTILARNSVSGVWKDCNGGITSLGYNIIGSNLDCTIASATGDQIGTETSPLLPRLGDLLNNGGPTVTHALLYDSPALESGNPATPGSGGDACVTTDQRGITRPVNATCDIGAFEGSVSNTSFPMIAVYIPNVEDIPGNPRCIRAISQCAMWDDVQITNAFQYSASTYFYYASNFGRDSLDNTGVPMIATVHYCPNSCSSYYRNAFWNGTQIVLGEYFANADDIIGHEFTHGVTQHTSGLFYYYQSGAINEALSDIFGEFIDLNNGIGDDTNEARWKLGEDLDDSIGIIRDLKTPGNYGQPDKMSSGLYNEGDCANFVSECDAGYVHQNSGVANKAAYLMVDGGTFNNKTVTALGMSKTGAVFYEAQVHLLTSGADYADLYNALYQGCLNLIGGALGITSGDCAEVRDATDAVEMSQQPTPNYNTDAPITCSGNKVPNTLFFDDLESGSSNFAFGAISGTNRWGYDTAAEPFAHSGQHYLFATDVPTQFEDPEASDSYAAMSASVTLPASPVASYLHFAHAYGFESDHPDYFDGGVLEYSSNNGGSWNDASNLNIEVNGYDGVINNDSGNPLGNRNAFVGDSHGYISTRVNLSSLAGQSVRFRWRMGVDNFAWDRGWWVDDIRIYSCGSFFADVPVVGKEWMQPWIEKFYTNGITTGCATNPLRYCPERNVTRAEMAVFVLRATHYPNLPYTPPSQSGTFADVPVAGKEWMEAWIEEFYDQGITTGCAADPLQYCPERNVTRAEMAVFLLRAKHGGSYTPPTSTHEFSDMPVAGKEWMEAWVDQFYREGITTGCSADNSQTPPRQFCPEREVTRAEMAVFVLRAFNQAP